MLNFHSFKKEFLKTNFDYYLVNTNDEFLNEYTPISSMKLKWLTNFTGSNGIALVGKKKNYFFTDGRYTLQAKKEIDSSFKILEIPKKLPYQVLNSSLNLGFDPMIFTCKLMRT